MFKECLTAHDFEFPLERAKKRMTDLKANTFSYLCTKSTAGTWLWTMSQPITAAFESRISEAPSRTSEETHGHWSKYPANPGRVLPLSFSRRCSSQCLYPCISQKIMWFQDSTYKAHTCLRTDLLSKVIRSSSRSCTHTFTCDVEFLPFEFWENFQELFQESYEVSCHIVLVLP